MKGAYEVCAGAPSAGTCVCASRARAAWARAA